MFESSDAKFFVQRGNSYHIAFYPSTKLLVIISGEDNNSIYSTRYRLIFNKYLYNFFNTP